MITLEPSGRPDTLTVVLDGIAIGQVRLRLWRWGILPMAGAHWPTGSSRDEHAAAQAVLKNHQTELRQASVRLLMRRGRTA